MVEDRIIKNVKAAEELINIIKERSQKCDSNIVYPISEIRIIIDNLFKSHLELSRDRTLYRRFHEILKNNDEYKAKFAYNCKCAKKFE